VRFLRSGSPPVGFFPRMWAPLPSRIKHRKGQRHSRRQSSPPAVFTCPLPFYREVCLLSPPYRRDGGVAVVCGGWPGWGGLAGRSFSPLLFPCEFFMSYGSNCGYSQEPLAISPDTRLTRSSFSPGQWGVALRPGSLPFWFQPSSSADVPFSSPSFKVL